jgi:hypothetical protein
MRKTLVNLLFRKLSSRLFDNSSKYVIYNGTEGTINSGNPCRHVFQNFLLLGYTRKLEMSICRGA